MPRSGCGCVAFWCAPYSVRWFDDVRNGAGVIEVAAVKLFIAAFFFLLSFPSAPPFERNANIFELL